MSASTLAKSRRILSRPGPITREKLVAANRYAILNQDEPLWYVWTILNVATPLLALFLPLGEAKLLVAAYTMTHVTMFAFPAQNSEYALRLLDETDPNRSTTGGKDPRPLSKGISQLFGIIVAVTAVVVLLLPAPLFHFFVGLYFIAMVVMSYNRIAAHLRSVNVLKRLEKQLTN